MLLKHKSCKDCPDRTIEPNCHTTCSDYLARKAEAERINVERKKAMKFYNYDGEFAGRMHQIKLKKKKGQGK